MNKILFLFLFIPAVGFPQDSYTSKIVSRIVYCLDGTVKDKEINEYFDRAISVYEVKLPEKKYTLDSFIERMEYCIEKMSDVRLKEQWKPAAEGTTFRALEARYRLSDRELMDMFFDENSSLVVIHVTHME